MWFNDEFINKAPVRDPSNMMIYNLISLTTSTVIEENNKIKGSGMEAALLHFILPQINMETICDIRSKG